MYLYARKILSWSDKPGKIVPPPPPIGHDTKSHDPSRTNFKYFWGGNFAEKVTNQVNADCVEQN